MKKIQETNWQETLLAVGLNHQYAMQHSADMNRMKFSNETEKSRTLKLMSQYGFDVDESGNMIIDPNLNSKVEASIATDYINKHRKMNQATGLSEESLLNGLPALAESNNRVAEKTEFISLANPHLDNLRREFPAVADKVERLVSSADFINTAGTQVLTSNDVKKLVHLAASDIISTNMEDFSKLSKWANEYQQGKAPVDHEELYKGLYTLSVKKKETAELFAVLEVCDTEVSKAYKAAGLSEESIRQVDKSTALSHNQTAEYTHQPVGDVNGKKKGLSL